VLVADLRSYRSHPDKKLLTHAKGVVEGTKERTALDIAEIAAIFHDVGKLNPHFQQKLDDEEPDGYANHSYLSAFAFLCYFQKNEQQIRSGFGEDREWIGSVLALIARHHGNLPDFPKILNEDEVEQLLGFLDEADGLPASEMVAEWLEHEPFSMDQQVEAVRQFCQLENIAQLVNDIGEPLRFYQETQFAFASLIAADKTDAGGYSRHQQAVPDFCAQYGNKLNSHLNGLSQDSALNRKRTAMRKEACATIRETLQEHPDQRVFSLTAPTGAGKTLMMLALARELIEARGDLRIIYALPFLSITEQVEEVLKGSEDEEGIFEGLEKHVRRIDSKAQRDDADDLLKRTDAGDTEAMRQLLAEQFAEDTFDYPFIVTTFVRVFETLVSNHNATLLKLPSFSRSIMLIDEIQALPPRLYGFFVAYLDAFCRRFDAYAIVSTATMPNFELSEGSSHDLQTFFEGYQSPQEHELLSTEHFDDPLFDRYEITPAGDGFTSVDELAGMVRNEDESVLVVLNTIQDTHDLFELLRYDSDAEVILLNTHFIPADRRDKITRCQKADERVILISTQLIEAGVDISFPVLYRDVCPVPSVVQAAGRCNRNRESAHRRGRVVLFKLGDGQKARADYVYGGNNARFLSYSKRNLLDNRFTEPEMLSVQRQFFDTEIQEKTKFGVHHSSLYDDENNELDFVERIKQAAFSEVGKFQIIDAEQHGEQYSFYVLKDDGDQQFEQLKRLQRELKDIPFDDHDRRRAKYQHLQEHLRRMGDRIVQVRISEHDEETSPPAMTADECFGIRKLQPDLYDSEAGLSFATTAIL
jgi:CRISPR-associated helicase Cas3/CRISPR-associated endonuclease Cas3-HD